MNKVLCFGELLLRLSPELNGEWIYKSTMPVFIGGAELNVATALSKWDIPSAYFTALPDNYLAKEIAEFISSKNIDADKIIYTGDRIGTYYLPQGADMKNAGVIYDRAYSSFSELQASEVDWDKVFEDVSWFHFSAISPALTQDTADLCMEAAIQASRRNIKVSFDLNHRAKLWKYGKEPVEIIPALMQLCDLIMGNIWAARCYGRNSNKHQFRWLHRAGRTNFQRYHCQIPKMQPGCQHLQI